MPLLNKIRKAIGASGTARHNDTWFLRGLNRTETLAEATGSPSPQNDLQRYFDAVQSGPGIWKWQHYFAIYDRHFSKFRNKPVNVLEIGIYSGGSLGMWKSYFGAGCTIFGVDIEDSCRAYEADNVRVFIGDQADRDFWTRFKENAPKIDIVIDDGGHLPEQQLTSFEELFPHLSAGACTFARTFTAKTKVFRHICADFHASCTRARWNRTLRTTNVVYRSKHPRFKAPSTPFTSIRSSASSKNGRRLSQSSWHPNTGLSGNHFSASRMDEVEASVLTEGHSSAEQTERPHPSSYYTFGS